LIYKWFLWFLWYCHFLDLIILYIYRIFHVISILFLYICKRRLKWLVQWLYFRFFIRTYIIYYDRSMSIYFDCLLEVLLDGLFLIFEIHAEDILDLVSELFVVACSDQLTYCWHKWYIIYSILIIRGQFICIDQ